MSAAPKPRTIAVCWRGRDPEPGQWLRTATGRIVYRIDAVEALHAARRSPAPRLRLTVLPVRPRDVPPDASPLDWGRTMPHADDTPAQAAQRLAIRSERAVHASEAMDRVRRPIVRQGAQDAVRAAWRSPDGAHEVEAMRRPCPLRRMARKRASQITPHHIAAADYVRIAHEIGRLGLSSERDLSDAGGASSPRPRLGPSSGEMQRSAAQRQYAHVRRIVGEAARPMLDWFVLANRDLSAWCEERSRVAGRRYDPQIEMGRLIAMLDVLTEYYAADLLVADAAGNLPV